MSNGLPIHLFTTILGALGKYQPSEKAEKLKLTIEYTEATDTHTETLHLVSKPDTNGELTWMLTPEIFSEDG